MELKFHIRKYKNSDKNKIKSLNENALKHVGIYIKKEWNTDLNNIDEVYLNTGEFLVGECDSKIVSIGGLLKIDNAVAEIKRMRVHPKYQGKGFGQIMLTTLENRARELGYKKLVLFTSIIQIVAQKLYLKNNYKEVRRGKIGVLDSKNVYHKIENIHYEKKL